ncbi:MAG: proteasome subunit beta [Arachnia sp.]
MHFDTSVSFVEFLRATAPDALPQPTEADGPHGTTIVAAGYSGGAVMAGDRRATMGSMIALRDIEKVFHADRRSVIGVAGVAGPSIELVRLFQMELEHYEKVEGTELSLAGKANRLAALVRGNFAQALQGLAVVPLFLGWDAAEQRGRMFSYDAGGGRYEERGFAAVGSGAVFARGALKKLHDPAADEAATVTALLQSLYDAADDDSATSGLDLTRGILPLVMCVSAAGARRLSDAEVHTAAEAVIAGRASRPGGPTARGHS